MAPKSPAQKVLMLTQNIHIGGLERMIFNLSTALKTQGEWEPQVFVLDRMPDAEPENDLGPALADAGVAVTSFLKPRGFSLRAVLEIRRKLSTENIRVLHTHDLGPLIYGALAKLLRLGRVRLIHTQHSFVNLTRRRRDAYYHRFFVLFADEVTVVSADTQRSYVDLGVPRRKVHIVPNGVRFPEKSAAGRGERTRNKKYLLGKLNAAGRSALEPFLGCFWLLYMARLHRTKGQDHALQLWEKLSPLVRGKSALLFIGPESDDGRMKALRSGIESAPDSARVLYMGTTHTPELWLGCSDLALSCSEFEGMPLGPIEAAGAGLPLVLSKIPGHEVVKLCSSQYPLSDPAEGARLVENMMAEIEAAPDDFYERTWTRAHEIRARYTLSRMSGEYARLYSA